VVCAWNYNFSLVKVGSYCPDILARQLAYTHWLEE